MTSYLLGCPHPSTPQNRHIWNTPSNAISSLFFLWIPDFLVSQSEVSVSISISSNLRSIQAETPISHNYFLQHWQILLKRIYKTSVEWTKHQWLWKAHVWGLESWQKNSWQRKSSFCDSACFNRWLLNQAWGKFMESYARESYEVNLEETRNIYGHVWMVIVIIWP